MCLRRDRVRSLLEHEREMRLSAERYISQRVKSHRNELQKRRRLETQEELANLDSYAEAERKAEAGSDMDIAIRKQRDRLSKLEDRIETRRHEL